MATTRRWLNVLALCLLAHTSAWSAPVPKQIGPATFEIVSIEYVDRDGKTKTQKFQESKIAQPPASAARSEIILRGTVTPSGASVKGKVLVGKTEYDFTVKGDTWEITIPSQACQPANSYKVRAVDGEVKVNGTVVPVIEKQLSIANN